MMMMMMMMIMMMMMMMMMMMIIIIIIIIIFNFYSAHIHYLSEALYKIISNTTIIKFRNKKIKN